MASAVPAIANEFLAYANASPSPFHAVHESEKLLVDAGYTKLREREEWSLEAGGKYYLTRNNSTLFAFAIGKQWKAGNGFNICAAHTDSPCLKVKPHSEGGGAGYRQLGVQTYGGGLWHTWFDRELQAAGRAVVKNGDRFESKLVRLNRPLLRIPTLCIHLNREVNTKGFQFNTESQLYPILATAVKDQLESPEKKGDEYPTETTPSVLLSLLAKELGCDVKDIKDFEICLADYQPGVIGGAYDEFLISPRLDNLLCSFAALKGLLSATEKDDSLASETNVLVAALFDNEEVGSVSVNGAGSNAIEHLMRRVTLGSLPATAPSEQLEIAYRRSFLISADMAHAIHPNYQDKHEKHHQPALHAGPVIKTNANQRYATNSVTGFIIRELAHRNDIPIQEFVVKNDSACGSTVGPMLSARGLRTVDIGAPQLSMHSIRETMGVDDVGHTVSLLTAFYKQFTSLDASVDADC